MGHRGLTILDRREVHIRRADKMTIIPNALSAQLLVEATETNSKNHYTTNG